MTVIVGIGPSYGHSQNGMIMEDMEATSRVSNIHQEVIIFRSTGPWSKRWIERKHPTKNFHVKGKSSNWGPQAGLVPYNGKYSKVGANRAQADKGTHKNDAGIRSGFAGKTQLLMTEDLIDEQLNRPEGKAKRTGLITKFPIQNTTDFILVAERTGDQKTFAFRATKQTTGEFAIDVYPEDLGGGNPYKLIGAQTEGPLEVMTSGEVHANKPMTGDYDLLAICPSWAAYGNKLLHGVSKPSIDLRTGDQKPGLSYESGVGLDNVRQPDLHTQSNFHGSHGQGYHQKRQAALGQASGPVANSLQMQQAQGLLQRREEHPDMGNLTPRTLRCITNMNVAMGAVGDLAALRRVHHNAESHRNAMFGAITGDEMSGKFDDDGFGDGFPFTVFQPSSLVSNPATQRYGSVCTLETYNEFKDYAQALKVAGYYVPKNWVWGI
jgi:hypothetical protein